MELYGANQSVWFTSLFRNLTPKMFCCFYAQKSRSCV